MNFVSDVYAAAHLTLVSLKCKPSLVFATLNLFKYCVRRFKFNLYFKLHLKDRQIFLPSLQNWKMEFFIQTKKYGPFLRFRKISL